MLRYPRIDKAQKLYNFPFIKFYGHCFLDPLILVYGSYLLTHARNR